MIDRRVIIVLTSILAISLVAFAVVVVFAAVHYALDDLVVARVLRLVASGLGIVVVVDLILLVGALAFWVSTLVERVVLETESPLSASGQVGGTVGVGGEAGSEGTTELQAMEWDGESSQATDPEGRS